LGQRNWQLLEGKVGEGGWVGSLCGTGRDTGDLDLGRTSRDTGDLDLGRTRRDTGDLDLGRTNRDTGDLDLGRTSRDGPIETQETWTWAGQVETEQ